MKFIIKIFLLLTAQKIIPQINDSIKSYLYQSKKYQSQNIKLSYLYALKAKQLAELNHDSMYILKSMEHLADIYWYSNQINQSLETYLRIVEIADSARFPAIYAYALYGIGWIECIQKKKI